MPKLSDTMVEGTIARWKKKQGDTVETGDILAEVETDKATMEMEAFDDGVLKEIYVGDGGVAKVGDRIALVLAEGESADTSALRGTESGGRSGKRSRRGEGNTQRPHPAPAAPSGARVKDSPLRRKSPPNAESVSNDTGSGPGGRIVAKDIPEKGAASRGSPRRRRPLRKSRLPLARATSVSSHRHAASHRRAPAREQDAAPAFLSDDRG